MPLFATTLALGAFKPKETTHNNQHLAEAILDRSQGRTIILVTTMPVLEKNTEEEMQYPELLFAALPLAFPYKEHLIIISW